MHDLATLKLKTDCGSCVHKCCSQPYDWVFLTAREISALEAASGLSEEGFVVERQNPNTGHAFRTLNLPCRFLDSNTGQCTVYESRPLVCRLFPFYIEPLTGHATLLPVQCGSNLQFLPYDSGDGGWRLSDSRESAQQWLAELWSEALITD
jgi:Fe-S-cluster containining protein